MTTKKETFGKGEALVVGLGIAGLYLLNTRKSSASPIKEKPELIVKTVCTITVEKGPVFWWGKAKNARSITTWKALLSRATTCDYNIGFGKGVKAWVAGYVLRLFRLKGLKIVEFRNTDIDAVALESRVRSDITSEEIIQDLYNWKVNKAVPKRYR